MIIVYEIGCLVPKLTSWRCHKFMQPSCTERALSSLKWCLGGYTPLNSQFPWIVEAETWTSGSSWWKGTIDEVLLWSRSVIYKPKTFFRKTQVVKLSQAIPTLREKCPNTEFFVVRIFLYSDWIQENADQKILCIWIPFTQCQCNFWLHIIPGKWKKRFRFCLN